MKKKKLLLTNSGFFNSNSDVTKTFFQMIGKEPQKIKLIIASTCKFITEIDETKPIYYPHNIIFNQKMFLIEMGISPNNIYEYYLKDKWNQNIDEFDAIIVNGGDCGEYASDINRDGFRNEIDKLIYNGGVYVGISAGSFLAMNYSPELLGYVVNCKFDVHLKDGEGTPLGLVDMTKREVFLSGKRAFCIIDDEWKIIE